MGRRATFIVVLAAATAFILGLVLVGVGLSDRAQYINQRLAIGKAGRHETCRQLAAVKHVLYVEHTQKLHDSIKYLHTHPRGAPSIGVSRKDVLRSIKLEKGIVHAVRPQECP